ncbi:MAG TPA: outer membrane beta-barrel protein [Candidatus Manganitrophaceae bacterium]|nr:outer membrane beta-barrel protein [Candidatus Manganitrophaceae bacterium]
MKGFYLQVKSLLWALVFASAMLGIIPSVYAADDSESKKPWYIPELGNFGAGIHGGYLSSKDADNGSGFAGAHLRFRVLSVLGIEVAGDSTTEYFKNKSIVVTETPLSVTGLIYPLGAPLTIFPWPVTPYLAGGVTWVYYRTDFRNGFAASPTNLQAAAPVEYNSAMGWHDGIGVDVAVRKNVVFNLEFRGTYWDFKENIKSDAVRASVPDISTNNYTLRAGLTFLFH